MKQILYIVGFLLLIFVTRKMMDRVQDPPEENATGGQNVDDIEEEFDYEEETVEEPESESKSQSEES